nr:putative ribonuclease H-like domain-containing protein [Tanacetum cinerariifolium]
MPLGQSCQGFKWSNVPGVKLSSLSESNDTFLSLQTLSDLSYLFGGFMDYFWSYELNISNFSPADRKILPMENSTNESGCEMTVTIRDNKYWHTMPGDYFFDVQPYLPNGKRAIRTKWVFRNKKDVRGIVVRNKARLVIQGYTQEEGIDYNEVLAPVARGTIDNTLFIKKDRGDILLVHVYVDDIIFRFTKKFLCDDFEQMMHKRFQMSFIGELTFSLGLQVKKKDEGIFISQDKYVADILKKFNFTTVKITSTPMEPNKALIKDAEAEDVDVYLYRSIDRTLMYLKASRPNIMCAVCACARFHVTPKTSHLHIVKRIFRYLKGQPKLGLWYPRDSSFDLEAFLIVIMLELALTGNLQHESSDDKDVDEVLGKGDEGVSKESRIDDQERTDSSTQEVNTTRPSINTGSLNINTASSNDLNLPNGKRAIRTKWVFRNKKDVRGIVVRNKARLVKQGYTQEEGIDYNEVLAPVARVYVDDIIFGSTKKFLCDNFEQMMHKRFQMSFIEELTFSLGLQVKKKDDGIFISQDKYVADILKKFNFTTVKITSTPIEPNKALIKDAKAEDVDVHLYRSIIGTLMYLKASRPNIMFAVCACARFHVTPKTSHLHIVKRIFRYLKEVGEGSGQPTDPQHTSTFAQLSNEEPITVLSSSQLKKTHKPRKAKRTIKISQSSRPIHLVADETIYKEWDDRLERAATTASSLETEQDNGNINRTQSMATLNEPLPQGSGSGSGPRPHSTFSQSTMANMEFCDTHNMVAYLLKIERSEGFHQIMDFLNTSHLKYALTKNPTIYVLLIQQFWQTAALNTLDTREVQITAIIDGKVKLVSKASIRRHLKLEDSDSISTLPNTKIFEPLPLMGPVESYHMPSGALTTSQLPLSSPSRIPTRQETKVPQPSSPTHTNVVDEAASIGVDARHEGAASTISSLDAGHDSDDKDAAEDSSKQERKIDEIDQDPDISFVQHDAEVQGRHEQENEFETEDISTTKTLVYIRRSASKDKASSFNVEEWEDIQVTIKDNEELALRIQAEEREKYSEAEKARLLVQMDDSNITMEEYIRLEEEKARRRGKVYN